MKTQGRLTVRKIWFLAFALVAFITIQGCQEDGEELGISLEEEMEIVDNNNFVESTADEELEIVAIAENALNADDNPNGRLAGMCATRSYDAQAMILTIDFGNGCTGPYGRKRSGIIRVQYSDGPRSFNSSRVITFDNYSVDGKQVSGSITSSKYVINAAGNYENTYTLVGYVVIYPGGDTFRISGERKREIIEGFRDGVAANGKVSITGTIKGVSTRGREFTHTITTPIIADFACRASGGFLRISGVKEMRYVGLRRERIRTVDYGDGTCDNTITITINERVYAVTGE